MDKSKEKDIKGLRDAKEKASRKGDTYNAQKYCNLLAEALYNKGLYTDSILEYKKDISLSKEVENDLSVAIDHRKIGECYCKLKKFNEALHYANLYVELSKKCDELEEVQGAFSSIGVLHLEYADYLEEDIEKNHQYKNAELAFFKSLDVCFDLHDKKVSDDKILLLRERLYLNLGNTYEALGDYSEALRYINKALVICREKEFKDDTYRCLFNLSRIHLKFEKKENAVQAAHDAVSLAEEMNSKAKEIEALSQLANVFFEICDVKKAYKALKAAFKISEKENIPLPTEILKSVMTGITLISKMEKCTDQKELLTFWEKLGDWYAELENPEHAIYCYLQQLALSDSQGISRKSLAQLYASIAVTYTDLEDFPSALLYFKNEMDMRDGDFKEKSRTYCEMAKLLDKMNYPFDKIKDTYIKAEENALETNSRKVLVNVYEEFLTYLVDRGKSELVDDVKSKLSKMEEESPDFEMEDQSEENVHIENSIQLTEEELQMLRNEDDEDYDFLEGDDFYDGGFANPRKVVDKVNPKGETSLQVASRDGETKKVQLLLKQDADVGARDICGWQPLHEACKFGHKDIALHLINAGADINDQGGLHCRGISPIHEAAVNGHFEVVKLLVDHRVNVNLKTKDGETALDLLQDLLRSNEDETVNVKSDLLKSRQQIQEFLLNLQTNIVQTTSTPLKQEIGNSCLQPIVLLSDSESDTDDVSPKGKRFRVGSPDFPKIKSNSAVAYSQIVDQDFEGATNNNLLDENDNILSLSSKSFSIMEKVTSRKSSSQENKVRERKRSRTNKHSKNKNKEEENKVPRHSKHPKNVANSVKDSQNDIDKKKEIKQHQQSKINFKKVETLIKKEQGNDENNESSSTNNFGSNIDLSSCDITDNFGSVSVQSSSVQSSTLFRIRVQINGKFLLIPCTQPKSAKISWLIDEVEKRYLKNFGSSLKICLFTKDNALLDTNDVIGDVIWNEEELKANILS